MEKQHPLVWIGVGIAGAGLGANNAGLTLLGVAVAVAGAFGMRRIVSELPPGIQKQVADLEAAARARLGEPAFEEAPREAPTLEDILFW